MSQADVLAEFAMAEPAGAAAWSSQGKVLFQASKWLLGCLGKDSAWSIFGICLEMRNAFVGVCVVAVGCLLSACAGRGGAVPSMPVVHEQFGSAATFSRLFDASAAQTCEAARRALLSQGYLVSKAASDSVEGQKSFQPQPERHVQMHIRVTCVPESADGRLSVGFVSALQDSFALKMASNSASLGVSMLGSVSVPVAAGHDSMIKIGSETVASDAFYDSFFDLMRRYLLVDIPAKAVDSKPQS